MIFLPVRVTEKKWYCFIFPAYLNNLSSYTTFFGDNDFFFVVRAFSTWERIYNSAFRVLEFSAFAVLCKQAVYRFKRFCSFAWGIFISRNSHANSPGNGCGNIRLRPNFQSCTATANSVKVDLIIITKQLCKFCQVQGKPIKGQLVRG